MRKRLEQPVKRHRDDRLLFARATGLNGPELGQVSGLKLRKPGASRRSKRFDIARACPVDILSRNVGSSHERTSW
jgi:hypothetical protein